MGIVPKGFQNIGYYLVEPIIPPACFDLPCKRLLSLSDCIANIYPPQTEDLSPRMMKLAEEARFSPAESRFSRLKDALVFYKEFSEKADGLRIVGQFAAKDIAGRFISENGFCPCEENLEPKMLLGGEILGFDGGLHSYLCGKGLPYGGTAGDLSKAAMRKCAHSPRLFKGRANPSIGCRTCCLIIPHKKEISHLF